METSGETQIAPNFNSVVLYKIRVERTRKIHDLHNNKARCSIAQMGWLADGIPLKSAYI